jgi:hypothetical protein
MGFERRAQSKGIGRVISTMPSAIASKSKSRLSKEKSSIKRYGK